MAIGNRLEMLLAKKNLTVKEFAAQIGVPATTLYSFIRRDSSDARLSLVVKICEGLDIEITDLLEIEFSEDGKVIILNPEHAQKKKDNSIALKDNEDFTPEELAKIEEYANFIKSQRKKTDH